MRKGTAGMAFHRRFTLPALAAMTAGAWASGGAWAEGEGAPKDRALKFEGEIVSEAVVALSPDGSRVAAEVGGRLLVWNADTGRQLMQVQGHGPAVSVLAFNSDGTWLACAGVAEVIFPKADPQAIIGQMNPTLFGGMVQVWDVATGSNICTRKRHLIPSLMAFSPDDSQIVVAASDEAAALQVVTGRHDSLEGEEGDYQGRDFPQDSVESAFSADRRRVITPPPPHTEETIKGDNGRRKRVIRWDMPECRRRVLSLPEPNDKVVLAMALSPDGTQVVIGGHRQALSVWSAESGALVRNLEVPRMKGPPHRNEYEAYQVQNTLAVCLLRVSPDGMQVASGAHDGAVRLWDLATGELTHELRGPQEAVRAIAFLPRNRLRVVSGGRRPIVIQPMGVYYPPRVPPPYLPLSVWDAALDRPQ